MTNTSEARVEDLVEIPRLEPREAKQEDKERKCAPVLLGLSRSGARTLAWPAAMLEGLAANPLLTLTGVLITGAAAYSLLAQLPKAIAKPQARTAVFETPARETPVPEQKAGADLGSLGYLVRGNKNNDILRDAPAPVREAKPDQAAPSGDKQERKDDSAAQAKAGEQGAAQQAPATDQGKIPGAAMKRAISQFQGFGASGQTQLALGSGNGLNGGAGFAGGMMRPFDKTASQGLKAYQGARKAVAVRALNRSSVERGSKALSQLRFADKKSREALGQTGSEGQSYSAAEAFSPASSASGGSALKSTGLGSDGSLGTSSDADGPIESKTVTATTGSTASSTGDSSDVSPWTTEVILAECLLAAASLIITFIGVLSMLEKTPVAGSAFSTIKTLLYVAAAGMAATAAGLGVDIASSYGQTTQGAILATGGTITAAAAAASLIAPQSVSAWVSVLGGIAGLAASAASMLSSSL